MINFWATWCGPCASELPSLDKVYQRHKDQGYVSVGIVTADRATDEKVQSFAASHGVSYPLVVQEPTVRVRLTHPLIWVGNFFGSILSVWLSACLLALFKRLETAPPTAGPVVNIN